MSMRSSTEKLKHLSGFTGTATTTLSNILLARLMISKWPKVTGSKLPGQMAVFMCSVIEAALLSYGAAGYRRAFSV